MEREKFLALQRSGGDYDQQMVIPTYLAQDLLWWQDHIAHAKCKIKTFSFVLEINSDASGTGWGVFCKNTNQRAHGHWNSEESLYQINYRELLAAFFGLQYFASRLRDREILLRIDNVTAIAFLNRMGGTQSAHLNNLTRRIWRWCEDRNLWIYASYVRSEHNVEADTESRRLPLETEWELSNQAFNRLVQTFGKPNFDLFASRINTKCIDLASWHYDPEASIIDAFTFPWNGHQFYGFPPFSIITRTLQKIVIDRTDIILVVPDWKNQPWYPLFNSLRISSPIYFQPEEALLLSVNKTPHPLWRNLTLVAALLSGRPTN